MTNRIIGADGDGRDVDSPIGIEAYAAYFSSLLKGNRRKCWEVVDGLMGGGIPVKRIYERMFRDSLYEIGELWEYNKISVATEHMATAITEAQMNQLYQDIAPAGRVDREVVVASAQGELHQVGGKMVADIFEMHGWSSYFLGADTPAVELLRFIGETEPDLVCLSLSVYFHMTTLEKTIEIVRCEFEDVGILIGGQAFRHGDGGSVANAWPGVSHIPSLDSLEDFIDRYEPKKTREGGPA